MKNSSRVFPLNCITKNWVIVLVIVAGCVSTAIAQIKISGVYPHLTAFGEGGQCTTIKNETGIGALVPWAGNLYYITYSAHCPNGSTDKLHIIDPNLNMTLYSGSIGGTPANRMIHRESQQLFIGPHAIDTNGNIRTIPYSSFQGGSRHTATMRHLTDPANKVYYYDMEGSFFEVNVNDLSVSHLYADPVPGGHGKGAYTSQGKVIVSNNGYSSGSGGEDFGALGEWDGNTWTILERRQFTDVTGPGGIYGAPNDTSPLWTMGWDDRSVTLKVLDHGQWFDYRLPKGSFTYEHKSGWYTEWPRIREVTGGKYLMDMFGIFYDFPKTFDAKNTGGLSPISTHLRYVPDFADWNGQLVLATDEVSAFQFGSHPNPIAGRSQSNLWFGKWNDLTEFGPRIGWGGPWIDDNITANQPSLPFLINGFEKKVLHLSHNNNTTVIFTLEIDPNGQGNWQNLSMVSVPANGYEFEILPVSLSAQWIRITANQNCQATAYFHYATPSHDTTAGEILFSALKNIGESGPLQAGLIRPSGENYNLQFLSLKADGAGNVTESYYEVNQSLNFSQPTDKTSEMKSVAGRPVEFTVDAASAIVTENNVRFRLPKNHVKYDSEDVTNWWPRGKREVESERLMLNIHGTFYEYPLERGMDGIKPIATHNKQIIDYCTWSGLLVLAGTRTDAVADGNYFKSSDNNVGLWFGGIDDIWKFGQAVGVGGPWKNTSVQANTASDQYLMTGYDKKSVVLSHTSSQSVQFTIEINFDNVSWKTYDQINVPAGQTITHDFPDGYNAHWVRLKTNSATIATAEFTYSREDTVTPVVQNKMDAKIKILNAYPNPFYKNTKITFSLSEKMLIQLVVYDSQGKQIRKLRDNIFNLGKHNVSWNGKNQFGEKMKPGIYYLSFSSEGFVKTQRLMLLN